MIIAVNYPAAIYRSVHNSSVDGKHRNYELAPAQTNRIGGDILNFLSNKRAIEYEIHGLEDKRWRQK